MGSVRQSKQGQAVTARRVPSTAGCGPVANDDLILGSDAIIALGRFHPDGPRGYRARSLPDAPIRDTGAEAEMDELRHREARTGAAG